MKIFLLLINVCFFGGLCAGNNGLKSDSISEKPNIQRWHKKFGQMLYIHQKKPDEDVKKEDLFSLSPRTINFLSPEKRKNNYGEEQTRENNLFFVKSSFSSDSKSKSSDSNSMNGETVNLKSINFITGSSQQNNQDDNQVQSRLNSAELNEFFNNNSQCSENSQNSLRVEEILDLNKIQIFLEQRLNQDFEKEQELLRFYDNDINK